MDGLSVDDEVIDFTSDTTRRGATSPPPTGSLFPPSQKPDRNTTLDDWLPSEETLENLLKGTSFRDDDAAGHDEDYYENDSDDDEIAQDLLRLSAAESDLRKELDMLMSWGDSSDKGGTETWDVQLRPKSLLDEEEEAGVNNTDKKFTIDFDMDVSARKHNLMDMDETLEDDDDEDVASEKQWKPKFEPGDALTATSITTTGTETVEDLRSPTTKSTQQWELLETTAEEVEPTENDEVVPDNVEEDKDDYLTYAKKNWKRKADTLGVRRLRDEELHVEQEGFLRCYTCPLPNAFFSEYLSGSSSSVLSSEEMEVLWKCHYDYVQPLSGNTFRKLYTGLAPMGISDDEPLPVRSCALRIRPDVLCGSVMDAVTSVTKDFGGKIVKRQGGHLLVLLPGFWVQKLSVGKKRKKVWSPPLCVDAQLATKRKSPSPNLCERILLVRFYAMENDSTENHKSKSSTIVPLDPDEDLEGDFRSDPRKKFHKVKESVLAGDNLREAAYILYQMEKVEEKEEQRILDPTAAQKDPLLSMSTHANSINDLSDTEVSFPHRLLQRRHRDEKSLWKMGAAMLASPLQKFFSDKKEKSSNKPQLARHKNAIVVPALSPPHFPLLRSAYRFILAVIEEVQERDLTYNSLLRLPFGKFPNLPTPDVHYCNQLRNYCREAMILSLLKSASSLEQYARETEKQCVGFVRLLVDGALRDYGMLLPEVPKLVPLTAYPLEFRPPEVSCPPWGQKVMEVLETLMSEAPVDNPPAGFERARSAVERVVTAFSVQYDEEQCARMGRKNLQVMDRLAKMQAFQREALFSLRDSYGCNSNATRAADHFNTLTVKATQLPAKVPVVLPLDGVVDVDVDDVHQDFDTIDRAMDASSTHLSFSGHAKQKTLLDTSMTSQTQIPYVSSDQVPLLKCGILVSDTGATGTCQVTAYQMLFSTQLVPLIGSSKHTLVDIDQVDLALVQSSRLSASSSSLDLLLSVRCKTKDTLKSKSQQHEELLSFVPSLGAARFKSFVDSIRVLRAEDSSSSALKFTPKGGFLFHGS